MRELAIEEGGDLLTLSGLLTIEHGRKLREALRGSIARGSRIFVSLAEVEDVDVAGLQILYAARAEALRDNKEFVWTELSAACGDMAALAGMSRLLGFPEPTDSSRPR
jgi:anti-anti-sigma regulatory factor